MKAYAVNTADGTYRVYKSLAEAKTKSDTGSGFKKIGKFWECEASRLVLFTESAQASFTGRRSLEEVGFVKK